MVSVCWAAKANATKLKPMIVFHGAKWGETKTLAVEFKNYCVVATILAKTTDYILLNYSSLTLQTKNHLCFLNSCPPCPPMQC